jgi:glycosyltransferase involved in cell wall biosynthesis
VKKISIVTPCYNEEGNVEELYREVKALFNTIPEYRYEHIFIDNCSTDATRSILRKMASEDKNVKLIFNIRNFGHIRSPFHGLLQAGGDAVILMVADFQDPVHLIKEFILKWEQGYKIVIGKKTKSDENRLMYWLRGVYYDLIKKISEGEQIKNFTGFGLYDKSFIDILKTIDDPYPYFRGLIGELGYDRAEIEFRQPVRKSGKTKNNFYTLYDIAMLGFVSHSKVPLRVASFFGFSVSFLSILTALAYFVYKLIYWDNFKLGMAPMVIGMFFLGGIQLFFLGMIGEYIGSIFTQVRKRPLVIEAERINF